VLGRGVGDRATNETQESRYWSDQIENTRDDQGAEADALTGIDLVTDHGQPDNNHDKKADVGSNHACGHRVEEAIALHGESYSQPAHCLHND
jgi:hypothetical protein